MSTNPIGGYLAPMEFPLLALVAISPTQIAYRRILPNRKWIPQVRHLAPPFIKETQTRTDISQHFSCFVPPWGRAVAADGPLPTNPRPPSAAQSKSSATTSVT